MSGSARLPSFHKPPVTEVALSVAFAPLPRMQVPQLGLLWESHFRGRFPKVEEHPPVDPMMESFNRQRQEFLVSFETGPPLPRLWFLAPTGDELVQVQRNWFARNWRKMSDDDEYPRYPKLRGPFESDLLRFIEFASHEKLGEFVPTQCEITYINHIFPSGAWDRHAQLDRVLKLVAAVPLGHPPKEPEQIQVAAQWPIDHADETVGRLHVNAAPAFTVDENQPIYVLTITARGRPIGDDVEGVLGFMDIGHEWIVTAFDSLTTPDVHLDWEKAND